MLRILLIEGNEVIRSAFRSVFEEAGLEVCEASDSDFGRVLFHQHAAQIVIIALEADSRPGLSFIQDVAYNYPDVKIIVLIEPEAEAVEVYARTFGASLVFVKPVHPETLRDAVEELSGET